MRTVAFYGCISLFAHHAFAQAEARFEVESIRPHQGPMATLEARISGPRLSWEAANLRGLIMFAFDLPNYEVAGDVPLLTVGDQRFTILAKAPGDGAPNRDEFRRMMQALLTDRFQLLFHRETRDVLVYALVVAKDGPKFKASDPKLDAMGRIGPRSDGLYHVTMPKGTMEDLRGQIAVAGLGRPILDKTGLAGVYDIDLSYTLRPRASDPDPNEISIFTALQEQLGLKLEQRKEPIQMFVVDRAERPGEN